MTLYINTSTSKILITITMITIASTIVLALSACGKKGALYLENDQPTLVPAESSTTKISQ